MKTLQAQGAANNGDKKVIFKNYVAFINCIYRINNAQVDDAHDINVVIPMYNLKECSDSYLQTSLIFWQYSRNEPA